MLSINKLFIQNLIKANKFSYYIHLKDHNKKINPQKSKLSLSFMNPRVVKDDAPKEQSFIFNLKRKTQKELERKMFEEYKQKVLKGQIDQDEVVQVDPLWGEGQKPRHYFQNLSKIELMSVSYPQSGDFIQQLTAIHQAYFSTDLTQVPSIQELNTMSPAQLVKAALSARSNQVEGIDFWHHLQKAFGNKFYELSTDELIQLNFALKGTSKKGTPRVHRILNDLIEEDLGKLNAQQLTSLYYTFRHSKSEAVALQDKILEHLEPLYQTFTFEQKVNWLLTYTYSRRPQSYKKAEEKSVHENLRKAHQLIFNLNFSSQISKELQSVSQCVDLIYSLAKLRAQNTKFLTNEILIYLKENIQELTKNLDLSYKALFYLQQVEGGIGVNDQELFNKLIQTLTEANNFGSLTKIQQIRTLYAIWNYNLMTDDIFELYKSVQIEADPTLLYYFCEIQLSRSSEREWQVLRNLAELNHIPIPYYQSVKRFANYIKVTVPQWDLTPIQEKLRNTEYYYDVKRGKDQFFHIAFYKNFIKHLNFTGQNSPFEHTSPIDNVELGQFANSAYQVSVDIVNESAFVPGTDSLKESYRNKIRSLENIGWKHVVLREKQLQKLPVHEQLKEVIYAAVPYIDEQLAVIQNRDYYRAEQIEALRVQDYWDNMIAEEAEGYRNNPEEYARKIAELAEKEKKLSQEIAKVE